MLRNRWKPGFLASLLLVSLLVAAQLGAIAHAHAHELGAPQTQVCSTCAAANQLDSACIDTAIAVGRAPLESSYQTIADTDAQSTSALVPRQRGPPAPL